MCRAPITGTSSCARRRGVNRARSQPGRRPRAALRSSRDDARRAPSSRGTSGPRCARSSAGWSARDARRADVTRARRSHRRRASRRRQARRGRAGPGHAPCPAADLFLPRPRRALKEAARVAPGPRAPELIGLSERRRELGDELGDLRKERVIPPRDVPEVERDRVDCAERRVKGGLVRAPRDIDERLVRATVADADLIEDELRHVFDTGRDSSRVEAGTGMLRS